MTSAAAASPTAEQPAAATLAPAFSGTLLLVVSVVGTTLGALMLALKGLAHLGLQILVLVLRHVRLLPVQLPPSNPDTARSSSDEGLPGRSPRLRKFTPHSWRLEPKVQLREAFVL